MLFSKIVIHFSFIICINQQKYGVQTALSGLSTESVVGGKKTINEI